MSTKYDLHLQLLDPTAGQTAGANFLFNFTNPIAVRGLQKLANRFVKILLTPLGSNPIRRLEGTGFPDLIGSNIDPKDDLSQSLLLFIDDAVEQVKAIDAISPWLDPDEKMQTVNLLTFNQPTEQSIEAWVGVVNVAGSQLSVLIPYAME